MPTVTTTVGPTGRVIGTLERGIDAAGHIDGGTVAGVDAALTASGAGERP